MKRASAGSRKHLPTAAGSAEIYDFPYVDRARISSLYAQLFPQGVLTNTKTTAQKNFSDESDVGSDIKIFKAGTKSQRADWRELSICLMPHGRSRWKFFRASSSFHSCVPP